MLIAGAVFPPATGRAAVSVAARLRYRAVATADGADLAVEAQVPPGLDAKLVVDPEAVGFLGDVERAEAGRWIAVPAADGGWSVPACRRSGCAIRYRFHLGAAARAIGDPDTAAVRGTALVAPVSTWLLRPESLPGGELRGEVQVTVPPPSSFVTGLPGIFGAADSYAVEFLPHFVSPYSAFGRFDREALPVAGATLELAVERSALAGDRQRLRAWVRAAAKAVATYFGRFPVDEALVLAVPQASGFHGKAMGGGGATVLIQMPPGTNLADPAVDWQAAHEMVHLAVPEMQWEHLWLSEGLATYVEPLARSMTGELEPASVWADLVRGLPKGLPEPGDRGLDRTHTWGRTYWGGALFAFVADLEIREQTHDQKSLATALRGALEAGADARVRWPIEKFLSAGDRATGTSVLTRLYQRLGTEPGDVDLGSLFRALGVSLTDGRVTFDDGAPLAAIRRSMIGRQPL